jgi:amidase
MWNLLKVPTVALPFGASPDGRPLGVQLIGPPGSDARLLDIATWAHDVLSA